MESVLKQWLSFILYIIPSGLLVFFIKNYWQDKQHQKIIMNGIRSQLKNSIMRNYYEFAEKGYIYTDAMECIESMYQSYHELGGNGFITKKVEFLRNLPNIKIEKEK